VESTSQLDIKQVISAWADLTTISIRLSFSRALRSAPSSIIF